MKSFFLILIFLPFTFLNAQNWDLNKPWKYLGPDEMPHTVKRESSAGIGPVEFIRPNKNKEGHLLAGSLSGGLFYTENGGKQWYNAGSDDWFYSGCAWADYHPENDQVWFAYSNQSGANGKPGKIGKDGGIMRTKNGGLDWDLIGDYKSFIKSPYISIYGMRFNPGDASQLFVMTSVGLYYTNDCLATLIRWEKVEGIEGWVYDLDFQGEHLYLSNFYKGKWNVVQLEKNDFSAQKKLNPIEQNSRGKRTITLEPIKDKLLIYIDYKSGSDAMTEYDIKTDSLKDLLTNQRVNFGSGHTFAVNPHTENEIVCGYATSFRKYSYPEMKNIKMGRDYHVDVEFTAFDPFDENKIYIATHGGVYVSSNRGESWEFRSKGLGVAEVMGMAVSTTDPNEIAIGCFHDGSSVLADWDKNGTYYWRYVNGGDALIPLIDASDAGVVYTSNQYRGGGLYYSDDTAKNNINIHALNGLKTSGWEMATVLHPQKHNLLFFNFMHKKGENKGNIDVSRTEQAWQKDSAETISDFRKTHGLKKYKVYGLFNSPYYPNQLIVYILHYDVNSENRPITRHRLFRSYDATKPAEDVIDSWVELDVPESRWMADVEIDPMNDHILYLSYMGGHANPETMFGDKGLVYTMKYKTGKGTMRREIDITRNIPNTISGRFNMFCLSIDKRTLLFATRTGVYLGNKRVTRGHRRWKKIGHGLPNCKIYGLHYHEEKQILTVGYKGRGVWRYYLKEEG